MDSVQPISTLPKAEAPRLPCPAHAPGYGEDRRAVVPGEARPDRGSDAHQGQPLEAYRADRALHAMLARLTGGISPVALSLAYIDWLSHLAAAPQRQMEISQDALRCASQFFESALHYFSPGQGPWSLIKPRPLAGNIAVALIAGLPPFYGALAVGAPAAGLVPWILAAWLHGAREIVKDVEDEAGDRAIGRRTLPIVVGRRPAQVVAAGVALLFVPASLLLPRAAGYGSAYFLIALPAQMAVLIAATWLILDSVGRVAKVSVLLKISMVVGLVALVAGKVA